MFCAQWSLASNSFVFLGTVLKYQGSEAGDLLCAAPVTKLAAQEGSEEVPLLSVVTALEGDGPLSLQKGTCYSSALEAPRAKARGSHSIERASEHPHSEQPAFSPSCCQISCLFTGSRLCILGFSNCSLILFQD